MKPILFALLLLAFTHKLYSDADFIYKSYDKDGNPVYSDREPNSKYEIIKKGSGKSSQTKKEETATALPAERNMDSIRAVTHTAKSDINSIYQQLYQANNAISGKVSVTFSIDQKGKVTNCKEDESGMSIASFNGKICEKISALNYGEVKKQEATKVNFNYEFKAESKTD